MINYVGYESALTGYPDESTQGWGGYTDWPGHKTVPLAQWEPYQTVMAASVLTMESGQFTLHLIPPGTPYACPDKWLVFVYDVGTWCWTADTEAQARREMALVIISEAMAAAPFGRPAECDWLHHLTHLIEDGRCVGFGAVASHDGSSSTGEATTGRYWQLFGVVDGEPFVETRADEQEAADRLKELLRGADPLTDQTGRNEQDEQDGEASC